MKKKLGMNWKYGIESIELVINQYDAYLKNLGIKDSTRITYLDRTRRFLKYCNKCQPSVDDFDRFREHLINSGLARQSLNNYGIALKKFYKMNGVEINFPYMRTSNKIPYSFSADDVKLILNTSRANFKHYTMLTLLFECALRASELCSLNIEDVDLSEKNLLLRDTKSHEDAKVPLSDNCVFLFYRNTPQLCCGDKEHTYPT